MNKNDTIIEAKRLQKTYDMGTVQVHALRGVDLTVDRGEMVVIMGPSGCGKTTLLNCLAGLDKPTEGSVLIEGVPLNDLSDDARTEYRARRMGFVFQAYNLLPVLMAVENVELPLLLAGHRPREAREKALAALGAVGLDGRENHKPAELSGGEQQRVAIARSLAGEPAIVWADEPTGNLDSETAEGVMGLIAQLHQERGLTVVLVTHDRAVAARADRVVRMQDGRVLGG